MKKNTLITILSSLVITGLLVATLFSINQAAKIKKNNDEYVAINNKVIKENTQLKIEDRRKDAELKNLSIKIEELNKAKQKNEETKEPSSTIDEQSQKDEHVTQSEVKREPEIRTEVPTPEIVEPQYAVFEGRITLFSFAVKHQTDVDTLCELNGLSNYNEFVKGESYRVK